MKNKILNLSLSENCYPVPRKVFRDLKKECKNINRYPLNCSDELLRKLAKYHNVSFENLCISNGLDELIL